MFNIFKTKHKLYSPVNGETFDLSKAEDPVFAEKMAGDGVAINATGDTFVAPCDGEISLIFETNHAYAITSDDGTEVLVHIGIDTVELKGEGFTRLIEPNVKVKAGTPIIKIDRDFILSKSYSLTTPLLITNVDKAKVLSYNLDSTVKAGESIALEYSL